MGEPVTFRVNGLTRLVANGFREGNIGFEVRVTTGDDPVILEALTRLCDGHPVSIANAQRLLQNGASPLEIDETYGCSLVALFTGPLEIRRSGRPPLGPDAD